MGRCHRLDGQHVGPGTHFQGGDAHHGRVFLTLKDPVDVHGQIAFRRGADGVSGCAGSERFVAEREGHDFRGDWQFETNDNLKDWNTFHQSLSWTRLRRGVGRKSCR